jgi:epsin
MCLQIVALLKDDEKLRNERARAIMARKRFVQNSMGISSDGSTTRPYGRAGLCKLV